MKPCQIEIVCYYVDIIYLFVFSFYFLTQTNSSVTLFFDCVIIPFWLCLFSYSINITNICFHFNVIFSCCVNFNDFFIYNHIKILANIFSLCLSNSCIWLTFRFINIIFLYLQCVVENRNHWKNVYYGIQNSFENFKTKKKQEKT